MRRLLARGQVLVEGRQQKKGVHLDAGQQVLVAIASPTEQPIAQKNLRLEVIAVRPHLIAVNKPAGQHCHPLVPGEMDTLANALIAHFPECAQASPALREGGFVHRLDSSTSGVIIAARSRQSYGHLRGLFSSGKVRKQYIALVKGNVEGPGEIDHPVQTAPGDSTRMRTIPPDQPEERGRPAQTEYWPLERLGEFTLVRARCHTGERHQVRVHLAHVGHPLVGDELYNGPLLPGLNGAFLHANALEIDNETFEAPFPKDRRKLLKKLGWSKIV
ncbi:MAG: RluA family pseudouridine synthase [Pseudomonadota bacterium]